MQTSLEVFLGHQAPTLAAHEAELGACIGMLLHALVLALVAALAVLWTLHAQNPAEIFTLSKCFDAVV
jgi:hypothetical protein